MKGSENMRIKATLDNGEHKPQTRYSNEQVILTLSLKGNDGKYIKKDIKIYYADEFFMTYDDHDVVLDVVLD